MNLASCRNLNIAIDSADEPKRQSCSVLLNKDKRPTAAAYGEVGVVGISLLLPNIDGPAKTLLSIRQRKQLIGRCWATTFLKFAASEPVGGRIAL